MTPSQATRLVDHFSTITDPRVTGRSSYPLVNVISIAICSVICGVGSFSGMPIWAEAKRNWLSQFLDLSDGIPSHDTINDVIGSLDPAEFEACLLGWVQSLVEITQGQVLAIDGKTIRGSYDKADKKAAIHMVSVWATANHISLGQTAVAEKSNEITAIPKLLELVDISGSLVTIDAMGCQTEIAAKIVDEGADYVLAVKQNQPKLHDEIQACLHKELENDFADVTCHQHTEVSKNKQERRDYYLLPLPDDFSQAERWTGLAAIGMAIRTVQKAGKETSDVRYYIVSEFLSAERFGAAVRGHWGIENNLHWQLDVTFGEDACRVRKNHGSRNLNALRKFTLSLLKQETTCKNGIDIKRGKAGWDDEYLEKVLMCSQV